jgi:hypothetical protein
LIVGVLLVAGCSVGPPDAALPAGAPEVSSAPTPVAYPVSVSIPTIGATSSLAALGLDDKGALAVPSVDDPLQAAWYAGADPRIEDSDGDGVPDGDGDEFQPGEPGPAIVTGHVDGVIDGRRGQPGVFARLSELKPGDEVFIDQADGGQLRFVVDRVERHAKDVFPTEAVYGATRGPELRLITCGGSFDRGAGHYVDNVVVFASLTP